MATPVALRARTVYPTRHGAFAPATFWEASTELAYIREVQEASEGSKVVFGICSCPAASFWHHQVDVLPLVPNVLRK